MKRWSTGRDSSTPETTPPADDLVREVPAREPPASKRQAIGSQRNDGKSPVKLRRAIIPVEIEGVGGLVQTLLVLADLVERVGERVVKIKCQSHVCRLVQAEESRIVVGTAIAADDVRVQDLIHVRSAVTRPKTLPEVRQIAVQESRLSITEVVDEKLSAGTRRALAGRRSKGLKVRLIWNPRWVESAIHHCGSIGAHSLRDIAERFSKRLPAQGMHIRYLLQGVALIQHFVVIADVSNFQQHVAAEFALVG